MGVDWKRRKARKMKTKTMMTMNDEQREADRS